MLEFLIALVVLLVVLSGLWLRHAYIGQLWGTEKITIFKGVVFGRFISIWITQHWLWRKSRASVWITESLECQTNHSWVRQAWGTKYGWGVFVVEVWPKDAKH